MHSMYRHRSHPPTPPSPPHRGVMDEQNVVVGFSLERAHVRQYLPSSGEKGLIAQIQVAAVGREELSLSLSLPLPTSQPVDVNHDHTHRTFLYNVSRLVVRLVEDPPTSGGAACATDSWLMPYGIFYRPDGDDEEEGMDGKNSVETKVCVSKEELARDAFLTQVHYLSACIRKCIHK